MEIDENWRWFRKDCQRAGAASAEDYLDLAYRMGAVKVLLKPFTAAALIAAIDELLPGDR